MAENKNVAPKKPAKKKSAEKKKTTKKAVKKVIKKAAKKATKKALEQPNNKQPPTSNIPPGSTITELLGESFLTDLIADWQEVGAKVIQKCRVSKPDAYLRLVATYAPKEFRKTIQPYEDVDDKELEERLRETLKQLKALDIDQGIGPS
jgi:hypothetical protein